MAGFELELSFTLLADQVDERTTYSVHARTPFGVADAVIRLPSAPDLEDRLVVVENAIALSGAIPVQRGRPSDIEVPVRRFSQLLSSQLLQGEIKVLFSDVSARAKEAAAVVTLVVHATDSILTRLPWELLWDFEKDDYIALRMAVLRYAKSSLPVSRVVDVAPLRVLALMANPSDEAKLAADAEQVRLNKAVEPLRDAGLLELTWMRGDSYDEFVEHMRGATKYHVFHFIGHGGFDEQSDQGYISLVDPETERTSRLTATEFVRLTETQPSLRLVVLNACDTGRVVSEDHYAGTASTLVRNGIAGVVAMQYPISDGAATMFSKALYSELAAFRPVAQAVTGARIAIARHVPDTLEWATPVVYLRDVNSQLFKRPESEIKSREVTEDSRAGGPKSDQGEYPSGARTGFDAGPMFVVEAKSELANENLDRAYRILQEHGDQREGKSPEVRGLLLQIAESMRGKRQFDDAREVAEYLLRNFGPYGRDEDFLEGLDDEVRLVALEVDDRMTKAEAAADAGNLELAATYLREGAELDPSREDVGSRLMSIEREAHAADLAGLIKTAYSESSWERLLQLLSFERMERGVSLDDLSTALLVVTGISARKMRVVARIALLRDSRLPVREINDLVHSTSVTWFEFTDDGMLVSLAKDGRLRTWWPNDGSVLQTSGRRISGRVASVGTVDVGRPLVLCSGTGSQVSAWNFLSAENLWRMDLAGRPSSISAALPGVVGVSVFGYVELRDSDTGALIYRGYGAELKLGRICHAVFAGKLKDLLFTASEDLNVHVWSVPDDELLLSLPCGSLPSQIAVDRDARTLACLRVDGSIIIWPDIAEIDDQMTLSLPASAKAMSLSEDGVLLLVSCEDSCVRLYSATTGECLLTLGRREPAGWVRFAPTSWKFAVAWTSGPVTMYEFEDKDEVSDGL